MNKQYKLYILDKSCYSDTLNKLYKKYSKDSIIEIDENRIAIEYDYKTNNYRQLIESMNEYRTTQSIITTSKFIKLMKSCIESNIRKRETSCPSKPPGGDVMFTKGITFSDILCIGLVLSFPISFSK